MPRKKARIENESVTETNVFSAENQENNGSEIPTILTLFRESENCHAHTRLITLMKINFYDKLNIDEFSEDFFHCCRYIISIEDRNRSEGPLKLVVKFVIFCMTKATDNISKENSLKLMKRLIKFLTWHHDVLEAHVRFNVVKAIKFLLNKLTDDIEIPDAFYEKIQDALLKRFWDIKSFIRAETAHASSRLQSPSDADCAIVISLIHLCKYDSSHTVRMAAMQALAITTKTLPVIITRCRDINDLVRKKSFDLLIKWKILKPLTVSKRLQIMETGLTDKSEIVKNACTELLKVWLHSSDNDPISLLKRLDVENMEEVTELILTTLFRCLNDSEILAMVELLCSKMNERRLVMEDHLCTEMAFFWKHLVQFLSEKRSDLAERIIPSVVDYELYIRSLFVKPMEQLINKEINLEESVESYTIIKHLLPIVRFMEIADEFNRQKMIEMIKWTLSSPYVPFNYVEHLMKLLVRLENNDNKICNLTVELINDLLYVDNDIGQDITDQQSINNTAQSSHREPTVVTGHDHEPIDDHPAAISRENNKRVRCEIVDIEIMINELNESITKCMQEKKFDRIENLVSDLKVMTAKKNDLQALLNTPLSTKTVTEEPEMDINNDLIDITPEVKAEAMDSHPWMASGMEHKIVKANMMIISMIQECNMLWSLQPSLRALFEDVILVSVQHADLCVRQKAIMSMGLCCLLDKDLAIQYFKIFTQSLLIDHESVKEISVKSLIDIFIRFGIEPFQEAMITNKDTTALHNTITSSKIEESHPLIKSETSFITDATGMTEEEYNKCTTELMTPIIDLLNSENTEIRSTVAVGLSKLIYNHRLMSSKLLSRLLLLWFNPETEDNLKLRQYLGSFFSNFSLMSADNQDSITNCFLITMRTLFKAPANSPLSEIDINNVINFFERVTNSKYLIDNRAITEADQSKLANPCHDSLAIIISNQILNAPMSLEVKYYVPMLLRLRLSSNNIDLIKTLEPMVAIMIKKIKDKKCILGLEKLYKSFGKRLQEFETNNVPNEVVMNGDVNNMFMDDTLETSISRPSLLELGSDGKKKNETYLGGRGNRGIRITDTISQMSSMNLNNSEMMDTTLTEKTSQEPPNKPSTPEMSADDGIFKKPANVRLTKSKPKARSNADSTINSSISSTSSTSTRVTRSSSQLKSIDSSSINSPSRVTRRSSQLGLTDSTISSINSDVTTSTRLPRRASQRNK